MLAGGGGVGAISFDYKNAYFYFLFLFHDSTQSFAYTNNILHDENKTKIRTSSFSEAWSLSKKGFLYRNKYSYPIIFQKKKIKLQVTTTFCYLCVSVHDGVHEGGEALAVPGLHPRPASH